MKKMRILFSVLTLMAFQAHATIDAVDFTPSLVCVGSQTTFSSTSVVSGGSTVTNWNWDLDADGQFDDAFGPSINFQFNTAGNFNVGLQIVTDQSETAAAYKIITVNAVPTADFTAADVCEGTTTLLEDQSTITSGTIVTWQWDLDNDGLYDNATGSSITTNFGNAGTYIVGLQVTSDAGCQSTTSENVTVDPMPTVAFSVEDVCLGDQTEFTAISTVSSGLVTGYDWELNGNNFFDDATGTTASTQFISDGNYQIGLQVTSDQGCVNDTFQLTTIAPFPFVNFSFDNACQNNLVQFTNLTANVVGTIDYEWSFGVQGSSTDVNPAFSFPGAGPAQVELIGLTSYGCADTLVQTLTVFPSPEVNFTFTQVCFGQTTTFTNITDPKGSTIDSYFWDFENSNVSVAPNPFFQFNEPGAYDVTLIGYTTDGCRDTLIQSVNVWELPRPEITAGGPVFFCEGESVDLTVNPTGIQNFWSTTETTQTVTVDTTGDYEVTITDNNGCVGKTSIFVLSWLLPELSISNDTTISLGEDVPLWITGAQTYDWQPSTYLDDSSSDMPNSIDPKETITYSVLGTDVNGCQSDASVTINVEVDYNLKPVNLFTPNGDGTNDRFYIGNIECYSDCQLNVYNRWGLQVYSSNSYQNDWKGVFNNDPLPDGTYYYVIECDGREDRFDGAVTILK
jgi:gliding motility-associated-like protein